MLERPISESGSSSSPLLPTPAAHDDGKKPGPYMEMKANLPGGPRYTISSLAVLARAGFQQPDAELLPTPGAWLGRRPENSMADPERAASRLHTDGRRGDRSLELPDALAAEVRMLPTPTAGDAKSSGSRNLEGSKANAGVSLTDVILHGGSTKPRLLPTPTGDDANNNGGPSQHERNSLPLNTVAKIASHGASTDPPSPDGARSSDEPLPGQLTIGDA